MSNTPYKMIPIELIRVCFHENARELKAAAWKAITAIPYISKPTGMKHQYEYAIELSAWSIVNEVLPCLDRHGIQYEDEMLADLERQRRLWLIYFKTERDLTVAKLLI